MLRTTTLERDDLDFLDKLLAHVQPADEMRRNAHPVEVIEDVLRDAVVEHALAVDHRMLLLVEGGGVILEELDQRSGLRALIQYLGLAFVDAAASVHQSVSGVGRAVGKSPYPSLRRKCCDNGLYLGGVYPNRQRSSIVK
jgi:hypothetical protein